MMRAPSKSIFSRLIPGIRSSLVWDRSLIFSVYKQSATCVLIAACVIVALTAWGCSKNSPTKATFLTVNADECIACHACERVCVADAISFTQAKAVIDPSKCIQCGKCVEACPKEAIW